MATQQPLLHHEAKLDGSSSCTISILSNSQDVILKGLRLDSDSPVFRLIIVAGRVLEAKINNKLTGQGSPPEPCAHNFSSILVGWFLSVLEHLSQSWRSP